MLYLANEEVQIKVWETQAIGPNDEECEGSIFQVGSEYKVESIDTSLSYGQLGDPWTSIRNETTKITCRIQSITERASKFIEENGPQFHSLELRRGPF